MPMIGPRPVPWENAMPVLNARLNRSDPMTSMLRSASVFNAHSLVNWSITTTTAAIDKGSA